METNKKLIPEYKSYCEKLNEANELVIKIPNMNNYFALGCFLKNIIQGIGFLSYDLEENNTVEKLSVINDLSLIALEIIPEEEMRYVDQMIHFSKQKELTDDEEKKLLKEQIRTLQNNQNYLSKELFRFHNP